MNFFKIICLFIIFIDYVCSADWRAVHDDLSQMSWRSHWLEAFRMMESGRNSLEPNSQKKILEKFAKGLGKTATFRGDLEADIDTGRGDPIIIRGGPIEDISDQLISIDPMGNLLNSGVISMNDGYPQNPRDRRWTAGWILDTMDIIRQQPFTSVLFDRGDIGSNDLLKIRALSGTFWHRKVTKTRIKFEELFSGVIEPGQNSEGDTLNVISCFHGLWNKQFDQIYFLPLGEDPEPQNFYPIRTFQVGSETNLGDSDVRRISQDWNHALWGDLFNKDDYVVIQISKTGLGGSVLNTFLENKGVLHGNHVMPLQGESTAIDHAFNPARIFAFGKPTGFLQRDEADFCLVSDVTPTTQHAIHEHPLNHVLSDNPLLVRPMRDAGHTPETTPLLNKKAVSIPLAPGMSGGPILSCEIREHQILCARLGVMHGINLIQEGGGVFFKGLIQPPPDEH